jgi:SAM-dependent methyltransferase
MSTHKIHSEQILSDYETLEPGEFDTWNPLRSEYELAYRLSLFYSLTQALGLSDIPIESMKVLDLGCGNGRSTRMYIDLGLLPEQLTGLDLRPGAIELAKKLHPAISYATYDGDAIPFADRSFNWISLTTVVSSIKSQDTRRHLADQIYQKIESGGYLFYYDLWRANSFAGRDRILPIELFSAFNKVWHSPFRCFKFIPSSENRKSLVKEFLAGNQEQIYTKLRSRISQLIRPSHEVLLVQKI